MVVFNKLKRLNYVYIIKEKDAGEKEKLRKTGNICAHESKFTKGHERGLLL